MKSIGERIRFLRADQAMTLAKLGAKASVSASYLSQIERDKTTPSLSTLADIAAALGVGIRHFFETEAESANVVRAETMQGKNSPGLDVFCVSLTPEVGNGKMASEWMTLQPNSLSGPLRPFSGEVFVFVVEGELTIEVNGEQFVLGKGDSIHFDGRQPHLWRNEGVEHCVILASRAIGWLER